LGTASGYADIYFGREYDAGRGGAGAAGGGITAARTGDDMHLSLWITLLILSAIAALTVLILWRRRQSEQK
jgi:hypothetical protein